MNPRVVAAQYAVRGELLAKVLQATLEFVIVLPALSVDLNELTANVAVANMQAEEYAKQLAAGAKLHFTEIIPCNIGNPQVRGVN